MQAYDPPESWPASVADGLHIDGAWVARVTRSSTQDQVDRAVREQATDDGAAPPIEVDAVGGHPVQVLASASASADMLVVGHRKIGAVRGAVLGSTALNLLIVARCPVTVVPLADETASATPDRSTVVVGVDRSEGSRRALQYALAEAAGRTARVLVVSAFLPVLAGPGLDTDGAAHGH